MDHLKELIHIKIVSICLKYPIYCCMEKKIVAIQILMNPATRCRKCIKTFSILRRAIWFILSLSTTHTVSLSLRHPKNFYKSEMTMPVFLFISSKHGVKVLYWHFHQVDGYITYPNYSLLRPTTSSKFTLANLYHQKRIRKKSAYGAL